MTRTNTVATPAADASKGQSTLLLLLLKLRTFIALIAVVIFFSLMAPNFVTVANVVIVSKHVAINAFLAIGMTFVILTGGIDLSVGAIVGLVGMVAGALVLYGIPIELLGIVIYPNVWEIIGIALLVGTFVGLVNGLLVTQLQVAPFIATLGMLYVARGTALLMSGGATFPNLVGKADRRPDVFEIGDRRDRLESVDDVVKFALFDEPVRRQNPLHASQFAGGLDVADPGREVQHRGRAAKGVQGEEGHHCT